MTTIVLHASTCIRLNIKTLKRQKWNKNETKKRVNTYSNYNNMFIMSLLVVMLFLMHVFP